MLTGSCLCGDVAWEIDGPCDTFAHCHCTSCRKPHGAAFVSFVTFPRDGLRWLRGASQIRHYESSPGSPRAFCGRCGSKLPTLEPFAYAFAGPLVGALGVAPSEHLCVASKAPWHTISDDLPQHPALPRGGVTVPTPRHTEPAPGKARGGCLCGRVAYEIDLPLEGGGIVCCHCSRCRAARATAHASNFNVAEEAFRWLRGTEALASYKVPDAARFAQSFCSHCGSILPALTSPPGRKLIPAGSLDDDPGAREALHIFVASKAPWFTISDDLPQYDTYPSEGFPPVARPVPVVIDLSDGDRDLDGILALQRANLAAQVGPEEAAREGFVTVVHTRQALEAMHALCPSVVARCGGEVVGYAIVMPLECRAFVPVLDSLFDKLATLPLGDARVYIMGQVCVAKPHRGRGLFAALYDAHHQHFRDRWDLCVTDVAVRNGRSLRAHEKVGFEHLLTYDDATDRWAMIGLWLNPHHPHRPRRPPEDPGPSA